MSSDKLLSPEEWHQRQQLKLAAARLMREFVSKFTEEDHFVWSGLMLTCMCPNAIDILSRNGDIGFRTNTFTNKKHFQTFCNINKEVRPQDFPEAELSLIAEQLRIFTAKLATAEEREKEN